MSSAPPAREPPPATVVWITGLPSSGKSKLARGLRTALLERGLGCLVLDGDELRSALVPAPGYSDEERRTFYETLGNLAALLARQGLIVIVPATAHRRSFREHARNIAPHFFEIWVDVPVEECRRRDKKGLYASFRAGRLSGIPGEDAGYEAPEHPDMIATGGADTAAIQAVAARLSEPS